jgi:ABC-type amino acid transport substrate-binding protein
LRIGIHIVGDDYAPPAVALARRGLAANITGYSLFGTHGEENPPARLVHAVAAGEVDLAIIWGPFAGYFARKETEPLVVHAVSPSMYLGVPFTYDVSVGVRKGDEALRAELDRALERNCAAVQSLLDEYGLPRAPAAPERERCDSPRQSSARLSH